MRTGLWPMRFCRPVCCRVIKNAENLAENPSFRLSFAAFTEYLKRMRILYFLVLAFFVFLPAAQAQQLATEDVIKAETYLRGLTTARADFIQRSSMGGVLTGKFYLDRPGKLRFEYNEVDDFIVADGLFIYFYDSELGEQSNAPIGQTLADFLLRDDLTLRGDMSVTEVYQRGGFTHLNVVQTADPAAGSVELIFSNVPYRLYMWRVTDPQGEVTEIELKNMETGIQLASSLFGYVDPEHGQGHTND